MTQVAISDHTGVVTRYADRPSRFGILPRNVDVWLPPGYADSTARYPVIYMHDGQNLFDPALAYTGLDWGVDEAVTHDAQRTGKPGAIVVGSWNSAQRTRDYMPGKPVMQPENSALADEFTRSTGGLPLSDGYLSFLTSELKPFIDATYRTLPDQPDTFVMGSSMGGLISLYALVEYPHVFGGAGCLSTHWPIGKEALVKYMGEALPQAGKHRLYFDFGTIGLDAGYEPYQRQMDVYMQAKGYVLERDWMTQKFEGAEHTERAWRERVHIPLTFLLGE